MPLTRVDTVAVRMRMMATGVYVTPDTQDISVTVVRNHIFKVMCKLSN